MTKVLRIPCLLVLSMSLAFVVGCDDDDDDDNRLSASGNILSSLNATTVKDPAGSGVSITFPGTVSTSADPLAIEYKPEDATVQGQGVVMIDGNYFFDASGLAPGTYSITITSGEDSVEKEVTVLQQPAADFTYATVLDGGKNTTTFTSKDKNATYNYTWVKDGKVVGSEESYALDWAPADGLTITMQLKVTNGDLETLSSPKAIVIAAQP